MRVLYQDIRSGVRMLSRNPAFSVIAVPCLGLGVAACIIIFSIYNGLFLCPLPVPHQDRLVDLTETAPRSGNQFTGLPYRSFHAWRQQNETFETMAVWGMWGANLSIDNQAQRVTIFRTTHEFFDIVGIHPIVGRRYTAEEDRPSGPDVVLLSYGFWERRFGKDPTILGRTLRLDGAPYTVIGVLPPEATFPLPMDLWYPLREHPDQTGWGLVGIGRLKEGVTVGQARDDLLRIHKGLTEQRPDNEVTWPIVNDWRQRYLSGYRQGTSILLGVVGLMLLIACCNVTSIVLARGAYRSKEMALRGALGATRGRIIRQVLTENLVLSAAGGILGTFLGYWMLQVLVARFAERLGVPPWMTFDLDVRCVLFCVSVVATATIISGLLPALHAGYARDVHTVLQTAGPHATASLTRRRILSGVVVGQIALALTLLIGAGLLLRSLGKVQDVDPGFRTADILTYYMRLPTGPYLDANKRRVFYEQHLEKVRALPGVEHAGLSDNLPFTFQGGYRHFDIEGRPERNSDPSIHTRGVMPGYLETMGVTLLSGRFFAEKDNLRAGERTAIVNETFANRFWTVAAAVGKRIRPRDSKDWMRVIGVTKDVTNHGLDQRMQPSVYLPYVWDSNFNMYGVAHTSGDPLALVAPIQQIVQSADSGVPVDDIQIMSQRVDESLLLPSVYSWVFGVFAVVGGIMAIAGIYGVISYSVSQRTQEIAIRVALGARPGDIARHVMRQGGILIVMGLSIGLTGAFALSRVLASFLFGVSATDVTIFTGVSALLVAVATLACYVPARRAARVDPIAALRYE